MLSDRQTQFGRWRLQGKSKLASIMTQTFLLDQFKRFKVSLGIHRYLLLSEEEHCRRDGDEDGRSDDEGVVCKQVVVGRSLESEEAQDWDCVVAS